MENHIIIRVDSSKNDNFIMTVGRIRRDHHIDIVNVFQGDEARELYKKSLTKKNT